MQQCYDKITDFCRNGVDNGVTEQLMRQTCGLSGVGVGSRDPSIALVAGAPVETDVQKAVTVSEVSVVHGVGKDFALDTIKTLREKRLTSLSLGYFKNFVRLPRDMSMSREEAFKRLLSSGFWVEPSALDKIKRMPRLFHISRLSIS